MDWVDAERFCRGEKKGLGHFFQQNWKESNFPQCSEQGLRQVPLAELDELDSNMR